MRVLFAGESPVGGSANYLLALLNASGIPYDHLAPHEKLEKARFKTKYSAVIFSDYHRKQLAVGAEKKLVEEIKQGMGFLMIGGWTSFSGMKRIWYGSELEKVLPVACLPKDDRLNLPMGAVAVQRRKHAVFKGISFSTGSFSICGLNEVKLRSNARVLLSAYAVQTRQSALTGKLTLRAQGAKYPLLVADKNPRKRIAVYTSDFAPHWCGGILDWGSKRVRLAVNKDIQVEISDRFVRFGVNLIHWLSGKI